MARRTKEEALETRNRILDAAEHVFYEKGVARTTLANIAEAAGVTRGAIYWHFENKGDLFTAMFDRVRLPLEELKNASLLPGEPDPLGRIKELCTRCLHDPINDDQRRRVFNILFLKCEFVEEMGPVMVRHQTLMREGLERIERGLDNAVSKGQLPADLDAARAARVVHAFIGGALVDMAMLPDQFDPAANAEQAVEALLDALRFSPSLRRGAVRTGCMTAAAPLPDVPAVPAGTH